MHQRPNLKLTLSFTDKLLEIAGWICLGLLWGLSLFAYTTLPEIIPTHFNASGMADDHGSKMTILFLPVIATLLFIMMTVLNLYPHIFNYPANITEENAERQYRNATRMIRSLKLILSFIFLLAIYAIYTAARKGSDNIGFWFLPIVLGSVLIPLVYFTIKAVRGK